MACMCVPILQILRASSSKLTSGSYNGTSELQLERMNVYFNEVRRLKISWVVLGRRVLVLDLI